MAGHAITYVPQAAGWSNPQIMKEPGNIVLALTLTLTSPTLTLILILHIHLKLNHGIP
ncbi:hypothetical protein FFLO_06485 [Filobasidium floriforme]|uniref:Uncharacterized protein n=1 Tax=Filobasidium floriforme TaxID=5210 RepID=A0A8K0NKI5_9TREE|nr:uncharacterized protein HD553DRAFT_346605 [Filobasidium floriforme]KAG7527968.1 hypothetical protein FFLO_06485 [Filobasidium floriforme]KAH8077661.1 hypothetical protein HD553DRAFT_346605 [Filobasidium floriforme]